MARDLRDRYRELAVRHFEGSTNGDSRRGNRAYKQLERLLAKIAATGSDHVLFDLYDDPEPWVQYLAATHTLEIDERRAEAKLLEVCKNRGIAGLNAGMVLREWRKGNLRFRK